MGKEATDDCATACSSHECRGCSSSDGAHGQYDTRRVEHIGALGIWKACHCTSWRLPCSGPCKESRPCAAVNQK
jgi:hypothetical protein